MSECINSIFREALEHQGAKLTESQISAVLKEVEGRGVPIDWNTWYHRAGTKQSNFSLRLSAVTPRQSYPKNSKYDSSSRGVTCCEP
jgi:hypothetical protein